MKRDIKILFVFALIIRLILAPLFYHPDIKSQDFHLQFLSQGVINIYQFIDKNKQNLPYRDTFNYLPLTYLSLGLGQIILKPILPPDFSQWLNDWGPTQNNYPNLFYYMLVLKIPYIFFDLALGYLLYKIYDKKILALWLFNPFSIYLIYVLANFDVIPVFFSVLAYYYLKKSRSSLAFIMLGIATALKLYPLLFFPFFIFYQKKNLKKVFLNTLAFLLPLLLSILPFVFNPSFMQAFSGSGLSQKILETKFLSVPLYPLIYFVVFIFYYFSKKKKLEKSFLFLFLAFIVLVNFHPQWLLWFLPFIIYPLSQTKTKNLLGILIIILALFYVILINDQFLFWGHLIPINYDFINISNPYQIVFQKFHRDPLQIQNTIKIIVGILSLIFIFPLHEKNN